MLNGLSMRNFASGRHAGWRGAMSEGQKEAVVLLSGGLDSMVTAGLALEAGFTLNALTIDYNQRNRIELAAASRVASRLDAKRHVILPLNLSVFGGSALTDDIQVPKEGVGDDIPVTYVPARNLVFLSVALSWAEAIGAADIFIGVNALDYSGYPDCRAEFIESFENTARVATRDGAGGKNFKIHAPLQTLGKQQIAEECIRLGLDPALSWSCYDPTEDGRPCGLCDACRLRRKGFSDAGIFDPQLYAADIT